eukprot:COSAG01_NODE_61702_length_288_cov_0.825397_1_plen_29_part_10
MAAATPLHEETAELTFATCGGGESRILAI